MNNRQRIKAILHYEKYDRLPIVHFGYWHETLQKWQKEGHISEYEAKNWRDGNECDASIAKKLGFDFEWYTVFGPERGIMPVFEQKVIEELPDGFKKVMNVNGVIVLQKEGAGSIPAEVDHTLKDRQSWEKEYLPRLKFSSDRINMAKAEKLKADINRENPLGLYCGSLFGQIRNYMGVEGISYLYADDEDLYDEIINTIGELSYKNVKAMLEHGIDFDFAHFWEDICFKNGPLVTPSVFNEKVGPHYKRICDLLNANGIDIISLDCDGMIDSLIPTWLENGVNTMFPIEVGTWEASIKPWREKYGRQIRGVGGMDKKVFAYDYSAIDAEIERLRPLVELGGYIPCPDHRIPPDAKWENVLYYCDKMHKTFG